MTPILNISVVTFSLSRNVAESGRLRNIVCAVRYNISGSKEFPIVSLTMEEPFWRALTKSVALLQR